MYKQMLPYPIFFKPDLKNSSVFVSKVQKKDYICSDIFPSHFPNANYDLIARVPYRKDLFMEILICLEQSLSEIKNACEKNSELEFVMMDISRMKNNLHEWIYSFQIVKGKASFSYHDNKLEIDVSDSAGHEIFNYWIGYFLKHHNDPANKIILQLNDL